MPDPRVTLALARLELRRGLRAPASLLALALFALLAPADWGGAGLTRQGLWTGALLVFVPAVVVHAAGVLPRWRRGEADWLGSRPVSRGSALLASWLGIVAAGGLWLAAVALVVEVRAGQGQGPGLRLVWRHDLSGVVRLDPGQGQRLELDAPPTGPGHRLRVQLRTSLGGAPTTDARLVVARGGEGHEARARIATRLWLEVAAPTGDGPLVLQLEDVGEGPLAWLSPGSLQLWAPAATPALGSLAVAWRAALLLAALAALALGASAWVGPGSAAGLALCAVPAGALAGAPALLPGADLVAALAVLGEGRVPAAVGAPPVVGAALLVACGLTLARPGLASWRHGR